MSHQGPHDHDRFEIYRRDEDRKWAWRLIVNENIVATDGGQGYENRQDCESMAERIRSGEFRRLVIWQIDE